MKNAKQLVFWLFFIDGKLHSIRRERKVVYQSEQGYFVRNMRKSIPVVFRHGYPTYNTYVKTVNIF